MLALAAAPASAIDLGHQFSSSFAGSGTNALVTPTSADVDNSAGSSHGDVYVTDSATHRVEKFDSAGTFILMFGDEVNETTTGDVCTAASLQTCKVGNTGSEAEDLSTPRFVSVDPSTGGSASDVYVADTADNTIHKYDEDGNLVTAWGTGGMLSIPGSIAGIDVEPTSGNLVVITTGSQVRSYAQDGTLLTTFFSTQRGTQPDGFAASPKGSKFYKANGDNTVAILNSTGGEFGQVSHGSATGMNVDSTTGALFIDQGGSLQEYKFNPANNPVSATGEECTVVYSPQEPGCPPTYEYGSGSLSEARGLGVNSATSTLYVADTGNSRVAIFTPILGPLPITEPPIGNFKAKGTAKPDGAGPITECYFEFGKTTAYGSKQPCEQATPYAADKAVTATLPGLFGEVTYHYRLVVKNEAGATNRGLDEAITPHPVENLKTEDATDVTQTTATLNGSFTGDGNPQSYYFEWGPTASYGHIIGGPAGEGTGTVHVSDSISGLTTYLPSSSAYHFRLVATTGAGTSLGPDHTFYSLPPEVPLISGVTGAASTPTNAEVSAQVNPGGGPTSYVVEYGPLSSYGTTTVDSGVIGDDHSSHLVSSAFEGLQPGTVYHYRFVATNFGGTGYSADRTFITPAAPRVDLAGASHVGQTSAHLEAQVTANGRPTGVGFEYGPSTAYGQTTASLEIGSDAFSHETGADLSGLSPGTTYHFRVVASNSIGTTVGQDVTFTTLAAPKAEERKPPKCPKGKVRRNGKCVKKPHRHAKRGGGHRNG